MSDLFELFPTPVMRVPRVLDDSGVRAFRQRFVPAAGQLNHHSGELSHSQILAADADPDFEREPQMGERKRADRGKVEATHWASP